MLVRRGLLAKSAQKEQKKPGCGVLAMDDPRHDDARLFGAITAQAGPPSYPPSPPSFSNQSAHGGARPIGAAEGSTALNEPPP